jgi:extracellular factor (EF) 3-hydroxypalmitic acid methyl ester biosynthesis protein
LLIQTTHPTQFLADVHAGLMSGDIGQSLDELTIRLHELRTTSSPGSWRDVAEACRGHLLRELLHQDPLTKRCYDKPRGYAGDASLIDLVYGLSYLPANTTPLGREIYRHHYAVPACESLRTRKQVVSDLIDRLAAEKEHPAVLSVACGHIREAQSSTAVRQGRVGRFVGLDQDPESLEVVERELRPMGVEAVNGTVKMILQNRMPLGTFDLVYAVGLYDYLPQPVAIALTARLWQLVKPGGTLLIPNLTPNVVEVGYMEAYMDWHMIYRDEAELEGVLGRGGRDGDRGQGGVAGGGGECGIPGSGESMKWVSVRLPLES